jgi:hypothetical protein
MATKEDEDIKKYSNLYYWLKYELTALPVRIKVAVMSFTDM